MANCNIIEEPKLDLHSSFVTATSCFLSIFGGLVIILTYFKIPSIRNTTRQYLLYLTFADLVTAGGNLIGAGRYLNFYINSNNVSANYIPQDTVCVLQSALTTTSSIWSFLWTAVIALHLFLGVMYNTSLVQNTRENVTVHIMCWFLPIIITVSALSTKALGEDQSKGSGPWCWISTSHLSFEEVILWRIVAGKGWEILTYLLTIILYGAMKYYTIKKRRNEAFSWQHADLSIRKDDEAFCLAWLILYCLRMWGTIRFFFAIFCPHLPESAHSTFLYLHCFGDSGQAFFNCLLYCLCDSEIRPYMCNCLMRSGDAYNMVIYPNSDSKTGDELGCSTQFL